jgi:general secretion pathway protein K
MRHSVHLSGRGSEGFIIVAVLWIISALATLALIYSTYLANSAIALSLTDDRIEADALVSAALELAAYRLIVPAQEPAPTRGSFSFRLNRGNVSVNFVSETARIDLNAAPKEVLSGLFTVLGARREDADLYADRIIGWRTPAKSPSDDGEDLIYRSYGLLYSPRRAPFANAGELSLVAGLPPTLVGRAAPFLTVFSGRAEVNGRDAAPEVVATLAGARPDLLKTGPSESGAAAGGSQGVPTDGSDAIRVHVRVALDNGRRLASEVVILMTGDDEPYRVLSWQGDADILGDASRVQMDFR